MIHANFYQGDIKLVKAEGQVFMLIVRQNKKRKKNCTTMITRKAVNMQN